VVPTSALLRHLKTPVFTTVYCVLLLYFSYDGTSYGVFCRTPTIATYLQRGIHTTVVLFGTTPPTRATVPTYLLRSLRNHHYVRRR